MAVAGRKPKASVIKLVTGNPGRRPLNAAEPIPTGRPTPPKPLSGRPLVLWRRYISRAWWLTEFDAPKAWAWVHLHAEMEDDPKAFLSSRLAQLRALGSELGLGPASRARFGAPPEKKTKGADYFG